MRSQAPSVDNCNSLPNLSSRYQGTQSFWLEKNLKWEKFQSKNQMKIRKSKSSLFFPPNNIHQEKKVESKKKEIKKQNESTNSNSSILLSFSLSLSLFLAKSSRFHTMRPLMTKNRKKERKKKKKKSKSSFAKSFFFLNFFFFQIFSFSWKY